MKTSSTAEPVNIVHWLTVQISKLFKKIDKSDPTRRLSVWENHAQEQLAQNRAAARVNSHWR